jgi:hypothetical protein
MTKSILSTLTDEELHAKLKTHNTLQVTTTAIFIVIILAWIVLGFWRTNLPVFIITVVGAMGLSASQFASGSGIRAEISKRRESAIAAKKVGQDESP